MTVKEMIEKLKEFPEDMKVVDDLYMDIEDVYIDTWEDINYPYDEPDKQVVVIY